MPSLSKNFKFVVPTGILTTGTSVAVAYPLYPLGTTGTQTFISFKDQGAGYYGTTDGLHTLMLTTTPSFVGTATVQASLAVDPNDNDWFDVKDCQFVYTTNSPGYVPSILIGANPEGNQNRVDSVGFRGQFTWVRTKIDIDSGAVLSVKYNY